MTPPTATDWRALIPDFLVPRETLAPHQGALRLFWLEGLLYGVSTAFVQTFLPLYALAFGASAADLGLMAAVSHSVAPFTYLAGAYLAERTARHKRLYVVTEGLLGRSVILLYAFIPFFFAGRTAVWVLIGLYLLRLTFWRLAEPARTVITGQIVALSLRGRFMSSRTMAINLGQLAITPLAGIIIASWLFPRGYQFSFVLATAAGLVGAALFARMRVPLLPPESRAPAQPLQDIWRELLQDRRLLALLAVSLLWTLGDQIIAPFFSVQMVRNLGLGASAVGFLASAATLASFAGLPLIGRFSDRRGNCTALVLAGLTLALIRLPWLWAATSWHLLPIHLVIGFVSSSFQVVLLNLLLAIARPEQYARHSALQQAAMTTMCVVGPLLGGYLFEQVGFASNVLVATALGLVAMAIAWRFVQDRSQP